MTEYYIYVDEDNDVIKVGEEDLPSCQEHVKSNGVVLLRIVEGGLEQYRYSSVDGRDDWRWMAV